MTLDSAGLNPYGGPDYPAAPAGVWNEGYAAGFAAGRAAAPDWRKIADDLARSIRDEGGFDPQEWPELAAYDAAAAGRAAATPDPLTFDSLARAALLPAASPDERLREALERIVDLPLVDDSDADRMREIAAEALPWKPGSDDPR